MTVVITNTDIIVYTDFHSYIKDHPANISPFQTVDPHWFDKYNAPKTKLGSAKDLVEQPVAQDNLEQFIENATILLVNKSVEATKQKFAEA